MALEREEYGDRRDADDHGQHVPASEADDHIGGLGHGGLAHHLDAEQLIQLAQDDADRQGGNERPQDRL